MKKPLSCWEKSGKRSVATNSRDVPHPAFAHLDGSLFLSSLILLVLEAGIDIDLTTLKLVGTRGVMIALVGTLLPVALAFTIALILGYQGIAAVAAGCVFAPTSLGIAMNILRQSNVLNTPVGQLIVAAAIIDDMVARKCWTITLFPYILVDTCSHHNVQYSLLSGHSIAAPSICKCWGCECCRHDHSSRKCVGLSARWRLLGCGCITAAFR